MARKLEARGFSEQEIGETLRDLESNGWLDDRRFAIEMATGPLARKGYGPRRLRAELERRGVEGEIAEVAVASVYASVADELDAARRALERRTKGPGDRAAAGRFLERRGFSTGVILTILDEIDFDPGT
ncbi:MAG: regulatory protein RecX [Thermoanaerobaculia bacterium]